MRNNHNKAVMGRDFKPGLDLDSHQEGTRNKAGTSAHWMGLVASAALFSIVFTVVTDDAEATRTSISDDDAITLQLESTDSQINVPLALPSNPFNQTSNEESEFAPELSKEDAHWEKTTVKSGDSLALIFDRMGLSPQELYRVTKADKKASKLKKIMPGQELKFQIEDNTLQQLVYKIDALNTLKIKRDANNEFVVSTDTREMEARVSNKTAVIDSSLFIAGQDAAEFVNRGNTYRALRYTDANGQSDYFSPDGKSMRKAFIRTPVDFTRISSRFGKRKHPTLNKIKNHRGVDYAAPRGTPIKAAGDGKLTFVGRKGGYGKTVIIQHGGKYSTLYAHMSRIKPGMRRGKKVRQGQTIGYVGSTGRSTGPHLHYEFRVNGVHRNPLRVKLPDAAPISAKFKADFLNKSRGLVALLDVLNRTTLALNDTDS